ncbi:transmembrane protein, putative (macronuclear) [Tetrahymena thermophila SB210]|uniref:Transmembrane protein, putative n=1 Tax=Tetrahymena thermophila (strain SB210) TaxID=312017 RepID=Q24CF2_TETTS|nr:transmembrane protein, putative [Tetrahymena thermophila SB210]EAS05508.2 transmembrane protein, putative [Tetrahymena thermophila SB210]|eukprot:XP_001025753.2 transmembrane protein, putative [Tetrahymena thermophila SB210]
MIEITQTSNITFKNILIIQNKQTYQDDNQLASYIIGVFSFEQLIIDSATVKLNHNLLFLNISNYLLIEENSIKYSIAFIDSFLTLQQILYEKNSFDECVSLSAIQIQNIQMSLIQNCTFSQNKLENSALIQIQNIDFVQFNLATFSLNACLSCVFSQTCSQINVIKSVFSQNLSNDSGSCLLLKNFLEQKDENIIQDSIFDNNFSLNSGGAIYLQNVDIEILNSIFSNNKASIGGAIRYLNIIPRFIHKIIKSGNANQQNSSDIQFLNNKAFIFGNNIGSIPKYLTFNRDKEMKFIEDLQLENLRSGDIIENLEISLLDEEQNVVSIIPPQNMHFTQKILNEIKLYQIQLFSNDQNEIDLKYNTIFSYQQSSNTFNISGMKIQGMPKKSSQIQINVPFLRQDSLNNTYIVGKNFSISVIFRDCQAGEFFSQVSQQIYECQQCLNNTYSLIEPTLHKAIQCKQCQLDKADSCNLNVINVKKGFWRLNQLGDEIIECQNQPQNCECQSNLNMQKETQFCCIKGFIGTQIQLFKINTFVRD